MGTLYIRTDANHRLGVGHVMRCCAIAEGWRQKGGEVCFLVSDSESVTVVEERGYRAHCLRTARWDHLETELPELTDWIDVRNVRLLLVDSYYVTRQYMEVLYQKLTLVYLGKFQEGAFPVHMVIDYTISVMEDSSAYSRYDRIGTRKLLGCRYFPLRREFTEDTGDVTGKAYSVQKWSEEDRLLDVLILTGGSDPFHVAWKLSCHLAGRYRLHVVVGAFCADMDRMEELAGRYLDMVFIYQNVSRMSELMRQCDLAVSAGGITLYELCACGLPTVVYTFADNQQEAVEIFAKRKFLLSVGDIRDRGEEEWTAQMGECLDDLAAQDEEREAMRERMLQLVDGRGVERIVENLLTVTEM